MLILPLLVFILPALFGIVCLAAWQVVSEKMTGALVGSVFGLALFTSLTYAASIIWPLGLPLALTMLAVCAAGTAWLGATTKAWANWRRWEMDRTALIVLALTFLLFSIIAPKLLIQRPDGLYTGIINAYGDVAWHASNITMFAAGQTFPPTDPIFAGTRLTYPFLVNFFSALLLVGGADLAQSLTLPAVMLIPLLLTLLYCFVRELTGSKKAAAIALTLFLFGGAAFGWTRFLADWQVSEVGLGHFLTHLSNRDYSGVGTDADGYHFLNPVTSLLLPQRSFLMGLPLAMSIGLLLARARNTRSYLAAGILAGALPLWHAHTVLALIPTIIGLFFINPGRQWLAFVMPAAAIGLPEVLTYGLGASEAGSFLRWGPGWMAGEENIIWYWWKNNGLLLPLVSLGLFLPAARPLKALAGAALFIWLAANLFLFAPWAWDNFKLFIYWLLFALPLASWLIARALTGARHWLVPGVVGLIVAAHIAAGGLDIWKLALPTAATWKEWDAADMAFAQEIQRVTNPGDSILTAPIHNSPVVLAGRPMYLGYAAHVWSHGGNPWAREEAIKHFYEGRLTDLPEQAPKFILVGPAERNAYTMVIQPDWRLVAQSPTHQLYAWLEQ